MRFWKSVGGVFFFMLISTIALCSQKKPEWKKPSRETIEALIKIKTRLDKLSLRLEKQEISPQELINTRSGLPLRNKQKKKSIRQFLMEENVRTFLGSSERKLKRNLLAFDTTKKIKNKKCDSFIYSLEEAYAVEAARKVENPEVQKIVEIVGPGGKRYYGT